MKKLLLVAAVAALAFAPAVASADAVSVGDTITVDITPTPSLPQATNGGPFEITTAGGSKFITFCVETNEFLSDGESLKVYNISNGADLGGVTGGSPDLISEQTAFIYFTYRMGNSFGWNTADIQRAIWNLEGEGGGALNQVVTDANTAVAGGWTNAANGGVQVINAYRNNGAGTPPVKAQSLLMLPDGGATLSLLGAALLGLGALRRKLN